MGDSEFKAGDILKAAEPFRDQTKSLEVLKRQEAAAPALRAALLPLGTGGQLPNGPKISGWLRKNDRKILGSMRICNREDTHNKGLCYRIERMG